MLKTMRYRGDSESSSGDDAPFIQENGSKTVRSGALLLSNLQGATIDPSSSSPTKETGRLLDPLEERKRKNRERMAARRKREREESLLQAYGDSSTNEDASKPKKSVANKSLTPRRELSPEKLADRRRRNRERMARNRKMQREAELQKFFLESSAAALKDGTAVPVFGVEYATSDSE
eukprot:gene40917-49907_t